VQRRLLVLLPGQYGVGTVLDEEGGRESVAPHDRQVKETVPRGVNKVKVAAVADQGVGDALAATKQGKVEGDVPFTIKLIEFLWQLQRLEKVTKHSQKYMYNVICMYMYIVVKIHVYVYNVTSAIVQLYTKLHVIVHILGRYFLGGWRRDSGIL
jgi:hypothetical protein